MATVLIADDAMFMRKLIREALEPLGFDVVGEAENGQQAVELHAELKPDLTTLDIVMPEMDGLSALEAIKKSHASAKVIMITAIDQRAEMLRAMRLGVSDFVVKPFDAERIVSACEKALGSIPGKAAR